MGSEGPNTRAPMVSGTIIEKILSLPAGVKSLPLLLPLTGSEECKVVSGAARALFHAVGRLNMLMIMTCR